jgi:hypothetical protein
MIVDRNIVDPVSARHLFASHSFLRLVESSTLVLACSLYDRLDFGFCQAISKWQPSTRSDSDEPSGRVRPSRGVALVLDASETWHYISQSLNGCRMFSRLAPLAVPVIWHTSQVRHRTPIRASGITDAMHRERTSCAESMDRTHFASSTLRYSRPSCSRRAQRPRTLGDSRYVVVR